jgi:hypothetical protein
VSVDPSDCSFELVILPSPQLASETSMAMPIASVAPQWNGVCMAFSPGQVFENQPFALLA